MHYRQTIREEIRQRVTGLEGVNTPPIDSRAEIFGQLDLPAVVVSFDSEAVGNPAQVAEDLAIVTRDLRVSIVLCSLNVEDLEAMAEAVELRMDTRLAPRVTHALQITRYETPERGEWDFFSMALEYLITYATTTTDPSRVYK